MKKYRLKQWYPSLDEDILVGSEVEYGGSGWICYKNKDGSSNTIQVDEEEISHPDFWELIEEKKPLFTTADKVEIFEGDEYIAINYAFRKLDMVAHNQAYSGDVMRFKYESNADEYIWRNKRVFSYEDMNKANIDINWCTADIYYKAIERSKE